MMRVKWPIVGVALVSVASVILYVHNTPSPDAGEVFGLGAMAAIVILAVVLVDFFMRRTSPRS